MFEYKFYRLKLVRNYTIDWLSFTKSRIISNYCFNLLLRVVNATWVQTQTSKHFYNTNTACIYVSDTILIFYTYYGKKQRFINGNSNYLYL